MVDDGIAQARLQPVLQTARRIRLHERVPVATDYADAAGPVDLCRHQRDHEGHYCAAEWDSTRAISGLFAIR